MDSNRLRKTKSTVPTPRPWHAISNEHVGEFVLMEITGRDDDGHDLGHILEVSPDEEPLHNHLLDLLRQKSGRRFALFLGKRAVVSGPVLEKAARKFVKEFYQAKEAARRAGQ